MANLSAIYRTRFEHGRRPKDIARAVRTARTAVDSAEPGDMERPRYLGILTLALLRDFNLRWKRNSLDEAMLASREALASIGTGPHPLRPALLANVANALRVRYEWAGDLTDLNESVALVKESVESTGPHEFGRFRRSAGLSAVLLRRFETTGARADIDGAIREAQVAFEEAPPDHPQRPGLRVNQGVALFRRFEEYRNKSDLRECIEAYRDAVASTLDTNPDRRRWLSQLSAPLRERYLLTGQHDDLAMAIATAAAAVRESADGGAWFNLGMALLLRHERDNITGEGTDSSRAAEGAFAQAVTSADTAPLIRANAAIRLARLSGGRADWKSADIAYGEALALLPVLTSRQLGWDSRQRQLARLVGLATDAAAVAVQLGDLGRAVLILEHARGILLGQSLDHHHDVDAVRRIDVGLADEFNRLSALLTADTAASSEFDADPASLADPAATRRDIASQWHAVIDKIRRTLPGQGGFLAPPEIGDLLTAAVDGPVVIVNVSRHRCDALIVRERNIEVEPLPRTVWQEGGLLAEKFVAATDADENTNDIVRQALDWLWKNIAEPVFARIGPDVRRMWWMPTGALSALPLHAAISQEPGDPAMADRVVASTTTTLRALIDARRQPAAQPYAETLIVAMSETPGQKPLPRAIEEAAKVAALVGGPVQELIDGGASPRAVLSGLRSALLVHLVCHAITNLADPASSAVLLARGRLLVRDIAALPRMDRYLVYLSACTTALSGGLLADESMHLASAFQLIGFRTVIGTLWKIDDDAAKDLADDFYHLLREGHEPAVALHDAIRVLRNRYPDSPALWAGFVHIGP
jgi:hypothetical protein